MDTNEHGLKAALAKMLPEQLMIEAGTLVWRDTVPYSVYQTELLHVCQLIENELNTEEHIQFRTRLCDLTCDEESNNQWDRNYCSATWQNRAEALAYVKRVEVAA